MRHKFVEFDFLIPFSAASLNQDDSGDPKSLPLGTARRTRVSSQAQKRWARIFPDDSGSLGSIRKNGEPLSPTIRSRETFRARIYEPMVNIHRVAPEIALFVVGSLIKILTGKKAGVGSQSSDSEDAEDQDQTKKVKKVKGAEIDLSKVLEIQVGPWTEDEMQVLLQMSLSLAEKTKEVSVKGKPLASFEKETLREWNSNLQSFLKYAGLEARLFGRLITGDVMSRIDGAVSVSHAFTVHAEQLETDYFTAVDDLANRGSAHIGSRQLSSGVFYGCSFIDLAALRGHLADEVIQQVIRCWTMISARPFPQTRKGSTAPFESVSFLMVRKTNNMPHTLSQAFLRPISTDPGLDGGDLLLRSYSRLGRFVREDLPLVDPSGGLHPEFRFLAKGERSEVLGALGDPFTADRFLKLADLASWASED